MEYIHILQQIYLGFLFIIFKKYIEINTKNKPTKLINEYPAFDQRLNNINISNNHL